jgi:hypothetical protein
MLNPNMQYIVDALRNERYAEHFKKDIVQVSFTDPKTIDTMIMALEVLKDQLMFLTDTHPSLHPVDDTGIQQHQGL